MAALWIVGRCPKISNRVTAEKQSNHASHCPPSREEQANPDRPITPKNAAIESQNGYFDEEQLKKVDK